MCKLNDHPNWMPYAQYTAALHTLNYTNFELVETDFKLSNFESVFLKSSLKTKYCIAGWMWNFVWRCTLVLYFKAKSKIQM